MELAFTKLHGLGNDFVFFDGMENEPHFTEEEISHICDRHFGVGADGVIVVRPSQHEDCLAYMHYINSDGSLAQMCGNGIRCFAKYLVDHGYVEKGITSIRLDTLRGPLTVEFETDEMGKLFQAVVDMDEPILEPEQIPTLLEANDSYEGIPFVREAIVKSPFYDFAFTTVSMGNPHAVCFIDNFDTLPDDLFTSHDKNLSTFDLNRVGAFYESNEVFPEKCNIEFATVEASGEISMRVFERGCGETLACGTGTCATLVAASLTGRSQKINLIHLLGGTLKVEWAQNNHVFMTGPAVESFTGVITFNS